MNEPSQKLWTLLNFNLWPESQRKVSARTRLNSVHYSANAHSTVLSGYAIAIDSIKAAHCIQLPGTEIGNM